MRYDIVYSVTAHESPECLWDMYFNIRRFHAGLKVLVLFHTSPELYDSCKKMIPENTSNPLFHPNPTVKARFTSSIFLAHLANYRYLADQGIQFEYFSTLASNCLFVRPIDFDTIKRETPNLDITSTGYSLGDEERWQAQEFIQNPKLVEVFSQHDIQMVATTHEGAYFTRDVFSYIEWFCSMSGIDKSAFVHDTLAAEEVLLPSIEKHATGKVSKRYGVWIPGITLDDVRAIQKSGGTRSTVGNHYNIVKIPRDMENVMRKYIKTIKAPGEPTPVSA